MIDGIPHAESGKLEQFPQKKCSGSTNASKTFVARWKAFCRATARHSLGGSALHAGAGVLISTES